MSNKNSKYISDRHRFEWKSNTVSKTRSHKTVARMPKVCPECHIVWEDWLSNTIRKRSHSHGGWVWRELEDFPAIGCLAEICPDCGDNSHNAMKVASGVC
ncbi:MAG: hypothetical protein QF613_02640 [Candidatus Marinimicrobia bacterium]|jgi:hypothetical protein|nr:hypothetical protein [Candidatus Neomarinimicrobiota bacterium]MDP6593093.1 hypothetical protein [Candidatus Neomarinimicrobiota bacterium]MDP6836392.1 hypothetical protein [Candidatus Neomarinimicrobiota bacterium]MDP6965876.1 hypothetical protein [Candidatus Neomarinimicrobiota bacterium]